MNQQRKQFKVLHVFWNIAPHLSVPIGMKVHDIFPNHLFALYKFYQDETEFKDGNKKFKGCLNESYWGEIKLSFWQKIFVKNSILKSICMRFLPEFSLLSFLKLVFGPRKILLHGRHSIKQFNLFSLLLLKLFGKQIYLIHWGGNAYEGRWFRKIDLFSYKMFSHIFVLMTPEIKYFNSFMGMKVSCLPYFHKRHSSNIVDISSKRNMRVIILGNSTHNRENYREVLDRLNPLEWDKIICMLNYGDEENVCETDAFVRLYKERFGDKFFAWRTTLPYDEYLKVMSEATFYICANKTQTGLGAISNSIRQGKTIILRGDNFKWMSSLGVKVYNYDSLENLDFQTLNKLMLTNEETQVSLDNFTKNAIQKFTHEYWKDEIFRCLE